MRTDKEWLVLDELAQKRDEFVLLAFEFLFGDNARPPTPAEYVGKNEAENERVFSYEDALAQLQELILKNDYDYDGPPVGLPPKPEY